ncbi:U1 small nuclear ribonucleoprotein [Lachnellula arida]|uniref:U1 small nuclear ribonucleoprotein n=1 Tax=Lachnellula arida TaxID=1316785 RepID=A0A8T9B2T0_9HELO|nr:U1 small nuclear ribonucleoprotein [Lachnellula arida]
MASAAASTGPPPSATVYARNLEERIQATQLIESLRELFSEYGTIIDIVAKTNLKAKGQAFIVFDTVEGAQKAIDEVQGFELFGKEMQLAFAKTRSDATVKRQGTEEDFESHKRRRLAEKGMFFTLTYSTRNALD